MNLIAGDDRRESIFFPQCLDDYIDSNSEVRIIDHFVDSINLKECGFQFPKEDPLGRGRAAYNPADLLKLFIYGYFNGVRSGRKLEKSCHINLEVIWLLKRLKPDFKTICDFRKNNHKAFKQATAQFTFLCRKLKLIAGETIAVDGTIIKASNNISKSWSSNKLDKTLKQTEAQIEQYLNDLESLEDDPAPDAEQRKEAVGHKLEYEQTKKIQLNDIKGTLEKSSKSHLSLTDPDSKTISKQGKSCVGYNVQTSVDSLHKLIVCCEVTDRINDLGLLTPMAKETKNLLELQEPCDLTADSGYYTLDDLKDCEDMGMIPYLPTVKKSSNVQQGLYGKGAFLYNPKEDTYLCPNKISLKRIRTTEQRGKRFHQYAHKSACRNCPLKLRCTKAKQRVLSRWEHEQYQERATKRILENKEMMATRKGTVEHPYGTIKTQFLSNGFLVRGKEMVQAECSLAHLAYNLKRVLNIMKFDDLIQILSDKMRKYFKLMALSKHNKYISDALEIIFDKCTTQLLFYTKFSPDKVRRLFFTQPL
jgi:transposase